MDVRAALCLEAVGPAEALLSRFPGASLLPRMIWSLLLSSTSRDSAAGLLYPVCPVGPIASLLTRKFSALLSSNSISTRYPLGPVSRCAVVADPMALPSPRKAVGNPSGILRAPVGNPSESQAG